jgi:hypothetical protein
MTTYFSAVVEWDGMKPPTTFYNRLRRMGIRVRGDKNISPVARRQVEEKYVVVQEGNYRCASYSLARAIALLAKTYGATYIAIETVETADQIKITAEDAKVLHRLETICGARGRPHGGETGPRTYCVTCMEEARSWSMDSEEQIVNCPSCGGLLIRTMDGKIPVFKYDSGKSVFENWILSRFSTGAFVSAKFNDSGNKLPARQKISIGSEEKAVSLIENSKRLRDFDSAVDVNALLRLYDAVFCSRTYIDKGVRNSKRVTAIVSAINAGIDTTGILLSESDALDEFDASPLEADKIVLISKMRPSTS